MDNNQPQDHHKPTKEELEAEDKRILAELDKQQNDDKETPKSETPPDTTEEESEEIEEDKETPESETPPEKPTEEVPDEKKALTPDDKLKIQLRESTREAQRLYKNNLEMNRAIGDTENLSEPTEEELQLDNPEWDTMSDVEKRQAKESFINKRFRQTVMEAVKKQRSIDDWGEKVTKFVDDPKTLIANPELEGKTEQFKTFASDKKLLGYEFDILVSSFLHGISKTKVSHKGEKMFETGQGGPNEKPTPKSNKISLEEGEKLRTTNYNLYKQKLTAGLIEEAV